MNPYGGSELEALTLYSLLSKKCNVCLWATSTRASKKLLGSYPIRKISLLRGKYPRGGIYVFVGSHWRSKLWSLFVPRPARLIYVFNTFHPRIADLVLNHPFWLPWPKTEVVLISRFQSEILGIKGVVHPSPIDLSGFANCSRVQGGAFAIGRLSRDVPEKHSIEDLPVYSEWLSKGFEVHIQGGTILSNSLPSHENLLLAVEGALPAEQFMNQLDVFYYRTGTHVETFGRVVLEAMAAGLPVVCFDYGGYAEHVRHGENGYLFRTSAVAMEIIECLYSDQSLRERIGREARNTAVELYSARSIDRRTDFYLNSSLSFGPN